MSEFKPTLSPDEKAAARTLYLALQPFLRIRQTMPLQYLVAYLLVAMEEGKSVNEYAAEAGVSPAVMTRHLLDIGDRNRVAEEGFGLITQERDRKDLRRHHARITTTGKAMMAEIKHALSTAAAFIKKH